jgi:hypothetical protein
MIPCRKRSQKNARSGETREEPTKGVESRFLGDVVKRSDRLLEDMETRWRIPHGSPARNFHLRTSGMRPTSPGSITCNCNFCGTNGRIFSAGTCPRERRSYSEAMESWFNAAYLPLMKEKGIEAQAR